MKRRRHVEDDGEINVTPMLDIVFIMLIFFIVTTSFVTESGLEASRPSAAPPQDTDPASVPIVVRIDSVSQIRIDGRVAEQRTVRANLEREKAVRPDSPLIVAAHPDADTESLVTVLDAARAAGIEPVSVATTPD